MIDRLRKSLIVLGTCLSALTATAQNNPLSPAYFDGSIHPVLEKYCLKCHGSEKPKGDLDLAQFTTVKEASRQPKVWQAVAEQLAVGEMPPKDKPQPDPEEKQRLLAWIEAVLDDIAQSRAGDPGPVVLRRLSNAEYTYTIRDLTGVDLDPAREFPVDGAAGEGFMNTGNALVMSPSLLTKYLDAGKDIASHAVFLPDGLRFSKGATRRDWSDEIMADIRSFYARYADAAGKLPLEKYVRATIEDRAALGAGAAAVEKVAAERGLNARYLGALWKLLTGTDESPVTGPLVARWRTAAPGDAAALADLVGQWQKALWRFQNVGHMKPWVVVVNPLSARQEFRFKIPDAGDKPEVSVWLSAAGLGDSSNNVVVWQEPRLIIPGRPPLALRDARGFSREMSARRQRLFASTASCLGAAAEAGTTEGAVDLVELSRRHGVDPSVLASWLDYLGIGATAAPKLDFFTNQMTKIAGFDFVSGWGSSETPLMFANSSTQSVRIPGNMKAHGVVVHPSPKLGAAAGWRSPMSGSIRVEAAVTHAHPECGNGVTWSLELRRGATRQRLATGNAQGGKTVKAGPVENIAIRQGDLISLIIGPRGDHSCDLTDVELLITATGENGRAWSLTKEISPDILASNPHRDAFGNEGVWNFYTEPASGSETGPVIPAGSLLARWQSSGDAEEKKRLAEEVQKLLVFGPPQAKDHPDAALHRQLSSLGGPLFAGARSFTGGSPAPSAASPGASETGPKWGLDPALFGRLPNGVAIEATSLGTPAPASVEVRLPADLVAGCELVTTAVLAPGLGAEGVVQAQVTATQPARKEGLQPELPVIVNDGSAARARIEAAFEGFRNLFPAALCYPQIVPVDEAVTLTLFHREDGPLIRLMLDERGAARINRLWEELHFVGKDALTLPDAFAQLMEYATQDGDPRLFEPFRKPINEKAAAFRQQLLDSEPAQIKAVLDFAGRAYRRPLTENEGRELRALYQTLRSEELPHEDALRLAMARVFVAPAFLYRLEKAGPAKDSVPVSDWELASRLSYFLWSSAPDDALLEEAAAGRLHDPEVLAAQARRMLRDVRVRRLATEFACQWLHVHDFDNLDEKSERHFPTFAGLKGAMYEESIRFFTDLFQNDHSVLELLNADHTFLNEALASHYGIPGVKGAEFRKVDGVAKFGRGGVLGLGATLAKQSGASRTSPILRGNWVAEVLLGDKLPRPPKDVPRLPEDEATETLTVRQLVEKHSTDPRCYGCHRLIDPYGYALEGFDAIGRFRNADLGGRAIDTKVRLLDGTEVGGAEGLRGYLLTKKRDAVMRQFSRKLLGYALGRGVLLSDKPLVAEMQQQLREHDHHFTAAVETIVRSRQFREIRGREVAYED